jgi:hypothetical protein
VTLLDWFPMSIPTEVATCYRVAYGSQTFPSTLFLLDGLTQDIRARAEEVVAVTRFSIVVECLVVIAIETNFIPTI